MLKSPVHSGGALFIKAVKSLANISLFVCTDDKEYLNKTHLTGAKPYTGTFRDTVSVMTPVFQIATTDNLSGYNYAQISDFGRYYYIREIKAVRNGLWELQLDVDVLMSFQSTIREVPVVVLRSEKKFNQMLKDDARMTYQDKRIQTYNFPRSLDANGRKYYLVLTGGNETILENGGD